MEIKNSNPTFESLDRNKLERMLEIKQLYENGELPYDEAKRRMQNEVGTVSPEEFAAAEQLLKDEDPDECRNEDVRSMLSLFGGLIAENEPDLPYGHPIDAYRRENEKAKELLAIGDELSQKTFIPNNWLEFMEKLMEYKVHFARKQNQLYSALERKGFDRPSTTMWTYDNYIRDTMNKAKQLLEEGNAGLFLATYNEMATDLRDLMEKEELILYPTALKLISANEFEEMKSGDREIGFCLIDMPECVKPSGEAENSGKEADFRGELTELLTKYGLGGVKEDMKTKILDVSEGKLTLEQINLLYRHFPVDISFVDENELVAFYTDTPHRVFPRSKGVIGRKVSNCHPPKSVHLVEEIIEKFRSNEQSKAEFWINKDDLFIYIVYVAVRDDSGKFRGVLEMMQDCTHIRKLEGSRTLLTWDQERQDSKDGDTAEKENSENGSGTPEITGSTKLKALLRQYPKLMDDLAAINPKFNMLKTPMGKIVLPVANVKMMSERSGMPMDELIHKLQKRINSYK